MSAGATPLILIVVNGREVGVPAGALSYAEVADMAG